MPERHYAHTLPDAGMDRWQALGEHLGEVARRAGDNAAAFRSGPWGALAGLWHDLGKYADDFQGYLRSFADHPEVGDASVEDGRPRGRVDHSSAGAVLVRERHGERLSPAGAALAMVIAGHHGMLPPILKFEEERLVGDEKRARLRAARDGGAPADLLGREIPPPPDFLRPESLPVGGRTEALTLRYEFWTRMLFSSLIDADRLDTEAFMDEKRGRDRARFVEQKAPLASLRGRLDDRLEEIARGARASLADLAGGARERAEAVLGLRAQVLSACREAAALPPGKFSLTVPTGGGKTLAALAFALAHAIRHGLRRVIVVIPFTSIIDQTARVYREAFGEELGGRAVVEHHSNLDPRRESVRNRLASENWDAPVVVTTSVQFFESLHACRGTAVRKLHNIARSVVVFDEAQTLPHHLRAPIFDALNQLVDHYGTSALFCTATQPALDLDRVGREDFPHLADVREVIRDVPALFEVVKGRVVADFPDPDAPPTTWEALAARIAAHDRVLAIVHRRDDARMLWELLPADTFHLSALMCAAHRRDVLAQVVDRLKSGDACRVVSTTLVEAGVDLDFPVVFRALGGVDAMAQAAGRCNREGRLADADGRPVPGRLVLFHSPSKPPPGLDRGLSTTKTLLRKGPLDLFDPATYRRYFDAYLSGITPDRAAVMTARLERDFPAVNERFRMIDTEQVGIVVPYGEAATRVEQYRSHPSRGTLRGLQPFVVGITRWAAESLEREGVFEVIHDQVRWLGPGSRQYHERFGLIVNEVVPLDPGRLVFDESLP